MEHARIVHAAYYTPTPAGWGLPMFFEGEPGVAKSSFLRAFAARQGDPCEVLSGAERGEGAFGVIPVPDVKRGIINYPAPDWTAAFKDGGLVFLDEITSNPPIIQAPCMGLMLDRRIGSHQLGPRVRVWAACNPASIATNGYDLSPPLANRGGWLTWHAPTIAEHVAYMLGQAGDKDDSKMDARKEEARVEAEWPAAYARGRLGDGVPPGASGLEEQVPAGRQPGVTRVAVGPDVGDGDAGARQQLRARPQPGGPGEVRRVVHRREGTRGVCDLHYPGRHAQRR